MTRPTFGASDALNSSLAAAWKADTAQERRFFGSRPLVSGARETWKPEWRPARERFNFPAGLDRDEAIPAQLVFAVRGCRSPQGTFRSRAHGAPSRISVPEPPDPHRVRARVRQPGVVRPTAGSRANHLRSAPSHGITAPAYRRGTQPRRFQRTGHGNLRRRQISAGRTISLV
jgi:hypothetical protein